LVLPQNSIHPNQGTQAWIAMAGAALSFGSSLGKSSYEHVNKAKRNLKGNVKYQAKDNLDHQAAAWAHSNLLAIPEVRNTNLKAIATRTRIVVDLERLIEGHVFDLNLIIDVQIVRHFGDMLLDGIVQ
jgi:hypothetical protein